MLNFCEFIHVYVYTTNHHLNKNIFSIFNNKKVCSVFSLELPY